MDLAELKAIVENLLGNVRTLQKAIDSSYLLERMKNIVINHYDIGELMDVYKLDRGYVNISYDIHTLKDALKHRYFLRRYKRGIREEEVRFEHSIIKHLMKKGFPFSAGLISTKDGSTYVKEIEGGKEEVYYAIFDYLKGEDKYTWDNPSCTYEELEDAARVLALYHSAVSDLCYEGRRYDPKIIDLLQTLPGNLMKYAKRAGKTKFDYYFLKHLDYTLRVIDETLKGIDRDIYERLPKLAAHCDFHPGNLKFRKGCVVGLFDFDWSRIEARCFDVALGITYSCTTWEGKEDGDILLDRVQLFLKSYQKAAKSGGGLGPLKETELHYLPQMIKASNLYVLNWDVDDYYIKKQNPFEYLIYLQHNVRTMRWIENNWDALKNAIDKLKIS
ncbi:MAG: phosphotransferase [Spirochaetota bacterium]